MKRIRTSQLKTHLSRYLRDLQESGEPIEVCVREEAVAYLTSAKAGAAPVSGEGRIGRELAQMEVKLLAAGLRLDPPSWRSNWEQRQDLPLAGPPPVAGDGRPDVCSVEAMREGREW